MNALELLKTWPGVEKANAETFLAFSAWRLETEYAGRPAEIRRGAAPDAAATLDLDIALDDVPHRLRIADSAAFADLHLLWTRRGELPRELLLALVEKECGALLQTIENAARRQLSVKGVAAEGAAAGREQPMRLTGEGVAIDFALDVDPALAVEWGRLDHLDVAHEAVRSRTRPIRLEFGSFDFTEAESAALAPGAALVLDTAAKPTWRLPNASDDLTHVVSEAEGTITFGQMADDDWPAVPSDPAPAVLLVRKGAVVARGTRATLGLQPCVRIESQGFNPSTL